MRNPLLPLKYADRRMKRRAQSLAVRAADQLKTGFTDIKAGSDGGLAWVMRQRPGWEQTFLAVWMPRANVRDFMQFYEKSSAVEDMQGTFSPTADPPHLPLGAGTETFESVSRLIDALGLPLHPPAKAFVIESEWNTTDVAFLEDATWWRLLWYTTA